ncbi:MAG: hypothetical protein CL581_03520 [Alteromonadaceae bacterium]|nr:hypothetical protein [Alteromonadaceae bacterium]
MKGGIHPDSIRTIAIDLTLEELDADQTITHISKVLIHEPIHICGVDAALVTIKRDTDVDNSEKQLQQPGETNSEFGIRAITPANVSLYTLPGLASDDLEKGGFGAIEQEQDRYYITTATLTAHNPSWTANPDLFGYFADGGLFVEYNAPSDQYGVRIVVRYVPRLQFTPAYCDPVGVMQHYWKCCRGEAEFLEGFYAGTSTQVPSSTSVPPPLLANSAVEPGDIDFEGFYQGDELLLNFHGSAQTAYSVRKLDRDYEGSCMRVRNGGTNAELDIGFNDYGDLDRDAIATHCGSNSGFVVTWYDQTGNGHHMTQSSTSLQPTIYNGTATLTQNKRPVLNFDGEAMVQSTLSLATSDGYTFAVGGSSDASGGYVILSSDWVLTAAGIIQDGNSGAAQLNQTVGSYHVNGQAIDAPTQDTLFDAMGSQGLIRISNHANTEGVTRFYALGSTALATYDNLQLQEIVVWHTDQSGNAASIEGNINNYFDVYA